MLDYYQFSGQGALILAIDVKKSALIKKNSKELKANIEWWLDAYESLDGERSALRPYQQGGLQSLAERLQERKVFLQQLSPEE